MISTLKHLPLGDAAALAAANRKVRHELNSATLDEVAVAHQWMTLADTDLEAEQDYGNQRLVRAEDKAARLVALTSIASSLMAGMLGFLGIVVRRGDSVGALQLITLLVALTSLLYLLLSVHLALQASHPDAHTRPRLDQRPPLASNDDYKRALIFSIRQNRRLATIKLNLLSSAHALVKRGIILFAVWAALAGASAVVPNAPPLQAPTLPTPSAARSSHP